MSAEDTATETPQSDEELEALGRIKKHKVFRLLECKLDQEERIQKAETMVGACRLRDSNKVEGDTYRKHYKALAESSEVEINKIQQEFVDGLEDREVECQEVWNYHTGMFSIIRQDTQEMIEVREITGFERQMDLEDDDKLGEDECVDGEEESPEALG